MTRTVLVVLLVGCLCLIVWFWCRLHGANAERERLRKAAARAAAQPPEEDAWSASSRVVLSSPLFRAVASSVNAGLVVLTPERTIHYLNTQAEELLDTNARMARQQGLISLLRDYQADEMVENVLRDREAREITLHTLSEGRSLHLRCSPLIAADMDETGGAVLIIHDVTQINMLERARRDLVANVSHELRTPLSSLKLLIETVQSEPPPAVAQRMLGQMAQEIDMVTQLVDELHELSQIESGRVTLKLAPGSIEKVIRQAFERIRPQAARKHIQVEMLISPDHQPVLMDENRIGQVLLNLLHNAIKFTPDNGGILVQTNEVEVNEKTPYLVPPEYDQPYATSFSPAGSMKQRRPGEFVVDRGKRLVLLLPASHPPGLWMVTSVTDTGIGIPSQDLPRIFERFYKVDRSRNRDSGGTGLGLAIARHLVERHGGRLWVESTEGCGSAFYFTLPLA
jgi:two-component system, OmpR family, phosphate regulon sensor histidine kinase PhoR